MVEKPEEQLREKLAAMTTTAQSFFDLGLAKEQAHSEEVARLRKLLEEGAGLMEALSTAIPLPHLIAWARRAREAIG